MEDKKQLARYLYLVQGKTQREIALEVGVSERTIYTWIHQYAWHKLKLAAYQAPATISDNLSSELVEMQSAIAAREPGKRYPTPQEADVIRKLILSIEAMKKTTSLSQNMQMMESFRDYVRPLNSQFSIQLAHYADRFLNTKSRTGYAPYQMEYGIDMQAAVAPFYEELDGDQPGDKENPPAYPVPCTDLDACAKEQGCNWPKCRLVDLDIDDPKNNRQDNTPWAPLPAVIPPMPEGPEAMEGPEVAAQKPAEIIDNKGVESLPVTPPQPEETGRKPAISEATQQKQGKQ
jgi:transposase-like protein